MASVAHDQTHIKLFVFQRLLVNRQSFTFAEKPILINIELLPTGQCFPRVLVTRARQGLVAVSRVFTELDVVRTVNPQDTFAGKLLPGRIGNTKRVLQHEFNQLRRIRDLAIHRELLIGS